MLEPGGGHTDALTAAAAGASSRAPGHPGFSHEHGGRGAKSGAPRAGRAAKLVGRPVEHGFAGSMLQL
jgi:uncharacterized protein YbjT (DUF2867 family)